MQKPVWTSAKGFQRKILIVFSVEIQLNILKCVFCGVINMSCGNCDACKCVRGQHALPLCAHMHMHVWTFVQVCICMWLFYGHFLSHTMRQFLYFFFSHSFSLCLFLFLTWIPCCWIPCCSLKHRFTFSLNKSVLKSLLLRFTQICTPVILLNIITN